MACGAPLATPRYCVGSDARIRFAGLDMTASSTGFPVIHKQRPCHSNARATSSTVANLAGPRRNARKPARYALSFELGRSAVRRVGQSPRQGLGRTLPTMIPYSAPIQDMRFVLNEVVGMDRIVSLPGYD